MSKREVVTFNICTTPSSNTSPSISSTNSRYSTNSTIPLGVSSSSVVNIESQRSHFLKKTHSSNGSPRIHRSYYNQQQQYLHPSSQQNIYYSQQHLESSAKEKFFKCNFFLKIYIDFW